MAPRANAARDLRQVAVPWMLVEVPVALFSAWTLAYHLTLALGLPARRVCLVWIVALGLLAPLARGRQRRGGSVSFAVAALLLAGVAGTAAVVFSAPNLDDLSFFHRAALQLRHLRDPFFRVDTVHDARNVPNLSVLHSMTSYEPLMAMGARALGLDPLVTYQRAGAFGAGAFLAMTLVLLAAEFGAGPGLALAQATAALGFLAIDGNAARALGNVTVQRFWQGKCILWGALLPATLLLAHRFLRRPGARSLAFVGLAGIAAVGLSGSATFLFTALVVCIAVAWPIASRGGRPAIATAALLPLGAAYPAAIGAAFAAGVLPRPDMSLWGNWEPDWWRNVYGYVVGDGRTLLRDAVLLFVVPALGLRGVDRRFLPLLSLVVVATMMNPLSGPIVLRHVTPANYWRLAYLLPLLPCAGLAATCCLAPSQSTLARAAGVLALAVVLWSFDASALLRNPRCALGDPCLPARELAFARHALPHLGPRDRVLAPEEVVWVLGLLEPRLRFVAGRTIETRGLFLSAGRADEGIVRDAAQRLVSEGRINDEAIAGLRQALARGLRAIVVPVDLEPVVSDLLVREGMRARVGERDSGYALLLLDASARSVDGSAPPGVRHREP